MKYNFRLPSFPDSVFELETSIWTGKSKMLKDNVQIEQSTEKGKPFLIPTETGQLIRAFPKPSLPDFVPTLEISGTKIHIVEKLKWFQYVLGGLPILLLFIGGAIGGIIGAVTTMINFNIFRQKETEVLKYLKVIGLGLAAFMLYFVLSIYISSLIN